MDSYKRKPVLSGSRVIWAPIFVGIHQAVQIACSSCCKKGVLTPGTALLMRIVKTLQASGPRCSCANSAIPRTTPAHERTPDTQSCPRTQQQHTCTHPTHSRFHAHTPESPDGQRQRHLCKFCHPTGSHACAHTPSSRGAHSVLLLHTSPNSTHSHAHAHT